MIIFTERKWFVTHQWKGIFHELERRSQVLWP